MHIYYRNLKAKIIDIVKTTKSVHKAIDQIAELKLKDGELIGKDRAKNVYIKHAKFAVKYIDKIYGNNIDAYYDKINRKIEIAKNY